jgi:excinuclease ABC subunit A
MDKPWAGLTAAHQKIVLEGDGGWTKGFFPGVVGWFKWLETKTYKMHVRVLLARYRSYDQCHACHGKRLNPTSLGYRVAGISLADFHGLEILEARRTRRRGNWLAKSWNIGSATWTAWASAT